MPFTISDNGNAQLFIKGSPDTIGTADLYIGPQYSENVDAPLYLTGPTAGSTTLFLSQGNVPVSGQFTTYIGGSIGGGETGYQGYLKLSIHGFPANGDYDNQNMDLRILGPDLEYLTEDTTLYIDAGPRTFASGTLSLYASGVANANGPNLAAEPMRLFVRSYFQLNEESINKPITTLHIEADFNKGQTVDLFINSTVSTGDLYLFTDGEFISTEDIPLFIKPPFDVEGPELFVIGYIQN